LLEQAFARVSDELRDGQLVCIFPEGRITSDGEMSPFRPGVRRILERDPVQVVPVALQGLWGSFFSRRDGAAMRRPFRRGLFNRIGIAVGEPLAAADATPEALFERVLALRGDWR
jgi:1-acyl-sn-glycerol-3-phosphate acyltransferase